MKDIVNFYGVIALMGNKKTIEQLLAAARVEKPKRAKAGNEEEHLQVECLKWLQAYSHGRCLAHHSPNEAKRSKVMGARLKAMGMMPGWPDLEIILLGGEVVFFEFKTAKGRQSESQKTCQKRLEEMGCRYYLCRSVDSFIETIKKLANEWNECSRPAHR